MDRRWLRFLGWIAWFVLVICSWNSRSVAARPELAPPDPLSLEASMLQDPDAVACLASVCSGAYDQARRYQLMGACQVAHRQRVKNALANKGTGLRSMDLGATAPSSWDCASLIGSSDAPSALRTLIPPQPTERELVGTTVLTQTLDSTLENDNPYVDDRQSLTDDNPYKDEPLIANQPETPPKPKMVPPPLPEKGELLKGDQMGLSGCAPSTMRVRYSSQNLARVWMDKGANWWELKASCLGKAYVMDPQAIVLMNAVEKTIPWWRGKDGRFHYDHTRYQDVLSGKRKLQIGGPPNADFFEEFADGEGEYGMAFQGYQTITLVGKHYLEPPTEGLPSGKSVEDPRSGEGAAIKTGCLDVSRIAPGVVEKTAPPAGHSIGTPSAMLQKKLLLSITAQPVESQQPTFGPNSKPLIWRELLTPHSDQYPLRNYVGPPFPALETAYRQHRTLRVWLL